MKKSFVFFFMVIISVGISANESISFVWNAEAGKEKKISVQATESEAFTVDWGDGNSETFMGKSIKSEPIDLSYSYDMKGNYKVSITAVSPNCIFIAFSCNKEELISLDLSRNPSLTTLSCYINKLTSLDVSRNPSLTTLSCYINNLTSLDLSRNPSLITLHCNHNNLTSLDVSRNLVLEDLICGRNQLTSLDVSRNTSLTKLWCFNNQLKELDVSRNPSLADLWCDNNQLISLDVTQNTYLERLDFVSNQLSSIDISKNPKLKSLNCINNQIPLSGLYTISQTKSDWIILWLTSQTRRENVKVNQEIILTDVLSIGGKKTIFYLEENDRDIKLNVDYTLSEGKVIFKKEGVYDVGIFNPAIVSTDKEKDFSYNSQQINRYTVTK